MKKLKRTIRLDEELVSRIMCHCTNGKTFSEITGIMIKMGLDVSDNPNVIAFENKPVIVRRLGELSEDLNEIGRNHPEIDLTECYRRLEQTCRCL